MISRILQNFSQLTLNFAMLNVGNIFRHTLNMDTL